VSRLVVPVAALYGVLTALHAAGSDGSLYRWAAQLHATTVAIYSFVPLPQEQCQHPSAQLSEMLDVLAQCFSHMPHLQANVVLSVAAIPSTSAASTSATETKPAHDAKDVCTAAMWGEEEVAALRMIMIRTRLVGLAGFPLSWLTPCYTWLWHVDADITKGAAGAAGVGCRTDSGVEHGANYRLDAIQLLAANMIGATFHAVLPKELARQHRMLLNLLDKLIDLLADPPSAGGAGSEAAVEAGGAEVERVGPLLKVKTVQLERGIKVLAAMVASRYGGGDGRSTPLLVSGSRETVRHPETFLALGVLNTLPGERRRLVDVLQRLTMLRSLACCLGAVHDWITALLCELRHL
jgi:hypothetical protein